MSASVVMKYKHADTSEVEHQDSKLVQLEAPCIDIIAFLT